MCRCLFALLLTLLIGTSAVADEIDRFLQSRNVVVQVYFAKGDWRLTGREKELLRQASERLQRVRQAGKLIRVEGFASPDGDSDLNYRLSVQRARTVKGYLQQLGVQTELFFSGFGEKSKSVAKLPDSRRVDVAVYLENRSVESLFQNSGSVERFEIQ